MKKRISILLLVCILAASVCMPATAAHAGQRNVSVGRATAGSYYYTINGVGYSVPDTVYVGYNHTTTGYYVGVAQRLLNYIHNRYSNVAIPVSCSVGAVDEIFGINTSTGVYRFQTWAKKLGAAITSDGIVGPKTWSEFSYYLLLI